MGDAKTKQKKKKNLREKRPAKRLQKWVAKPDESKKKQKEGGGRWDCGEHRAKTQKGVFLGGGKKNKTKAWPRKHTWREKRKRGKHPNRGAKTRGGASPHGGDKGRPRDAGFRLQEHGKGGGGVSKMAVKKRPGQNPGKKERANS